MDSTTVWSAARRLNYSPQQCTTPYSCAAQDTGLNITALNDELSDVEGSSFRLQLSPLMTQLGLKHSNVGHVRACVAGTQTASHRANQALNTRSPNTSLYGEATDESSGFGSLLVGDSEANNSALSSHSKSTDCTKPHWQNHNSSSPSNSDASDGVNISEQHVDRGEQVPNSIFRGDYSALVANVQPTASLETNNSPTSANPIKSENRRFNEVPSSYGVSASAFQPVSGRESRMLEENLASVARYVEELTGFGAASGTGTKFGKCANERFYVSQQTQGSLASCNTSHQHQQQQRHLPSKPQLQQLNEQLAALKADKNIDKEIAKTNSQEQLFRLLASQFPDLVVTANNLVATSTQDMSNWDTENQLLHESTDNLQRRSANSSYQFDDMELPRSSGYSNNSTLPTRLNDLIYDTELRRGNTCGLEAHDSRGDKIFRQNYDLSTLMNSLPASSQRALANYQSAMSLSNTQQVTSAIASPHSGLAGMIQLDTYGNSSGNHAMTNQTATVLSSLLTSLQDRGINSPIIRDGPRSTFRPSSFGCPSESSLANQPCSISLGEELLRLAAPYQKLLGALESDIDHAANIYRNSASTVAQKSEAAFHWSGRLPVRIYRSMTFSRKVFLGGVPWDSTSEDLIMAFSIFGNVTVSWPQQEAYNVCSFRGRTATPKGYCYLIFDHESSVNELLAACARDPTTGGDYYKISSSKFKSKDVQVIPWVISDSQYTKSGPYRPDSKRTVFIGALHGMITAEALVNIMNDLFGNVVFAALDTDKYKYPIGSGRVAFSSHKSYMRAVTANFVDVRTSKFVKTIQIDPYLEDSLCNSCFNSPGIYFCRAFECFRYFCPACWQLWHRSTETLNAHKPLRRTFKPVTDRTWPMMTKF